MHVTKYVRSSEHHTTFIGQYVVTAQKCPSSGQVGIFFCTEHNPELLHPSFIEYTCHRGMVAIEFPLFHARFLSTPALTPVYNHTNQTDLQPKKWLAPPCGAAAQQGAELLMEGSNAAGTSSTDVTLIEPAPLQRPINLRALDLRVLPKDDGPPSETQLRRAKFQFFDKHCSEISTGLFLSGDTVARNREQLREHGITHVLNCVGFVCKEYFKGELDYRTYFLQDTPSEDILCILYDAFDFIEDALQQGGKILVHCSQGVSRSATIIIAYIMWKTGATYDEVYAKVKAIRGVVNPNIGFTCQLLQWQKRRRAPPKQSRLYRMSQHCQHAPQFFVPRPVPSSDKHDETQPCQQPDSTAAYIKQVPGEIFVWIGSQCSPSMAEAASASAERLRKYEVTGAPAVRVHRQGEEPDELLELGDAVVSDTDNHLISLRRASTIGDMSMNDHLSSSLMSQDDDWVMTLDTENHQ